MFGVSCGDADRYYPRVIDVLQLLDELGVNYVWLKQKGSHAAPVWSEDLYLFFTTPFPIDSGITDKRRSRLLR